MTESNKQAHHSVQDDVRILPILPSKDLVLFPHMVVPWVVEAESLIKLVDDALAEDRTVAVVKVKDAEEGKLTLNKIGTVALILRMTRQEEGHAKLIIQGVGRVRLVELLEEGPYLKAKVEPVEDLPSHDLEVQALVVNVREAFSKVLGLSPNLPNELGGIASNLDSPGSLADIVVSYLNVPSEQKQDVLETLDVKARLEKALRILTQQLDILELGHKIQSQVKGQLEKTQKEYYLREQLKAIRKELGEGEAETDEAEDFRERIHAKGLPEEALKEAERELDRLAKMHPSSAEYTVARTYLEWVLELPWTETTEDHLDLEEAERILNEDHFDLEKIKKRILEYLAVRKLKPDLKGPILCFFGPPGTGKTSLGKSIARCMGRKFLRIALGGMRDEAEIRGHRRTYIGAMPGRIVQGLRKVGTKNPVFMLDEIDKIGTDFRGDPASALLEVLDPEQNVAFTDHYLGVDFDLSKVIFIATANMLDTIPAPLLDRMEVLELSGYTLEEKLEIARRYLVPRQLEGHGLTSKNLSIDKRALARIVTSYTREAGVRNLERQIAAVCRGVAKDVALGHKTRVRIGAAKVKDYLGPERFESEVAARTRIPGVATGLAWTPTGGEILFIEATKMNGAGRLILTGKLGEVMKESAQTALSYVRSKASELRIDEDVFKQSDVHVHVPAGAIPKDGPSAGVALCMALVSLFTDRHVSPEVAMTGEVTLRGIVLPVGGIKEKVLAAHRAGIKEVLLPKRNVQDLDEIPEQVRSELKFHPISRVDEAVDVVFGKKRRRRRRVDTQGGIN